MIKVRRPVYRAISTAKKLRHVAYAFSERRRRKSDRGPLTQSWRAVLQTGQQQLQVVPPLAASGTVKRDLRLDDLLFCLALFD